MHLYALPEAKMSSKTTVGNLPLRLPCFEILFLEKGLWISEGGRIYKQLLWKVAKKTSHTTVNCPQIKKMSGQLSWLRILLTFAWLCLTGSRMILMFGRREGIVMFFVSCRRAWSIFNDIAFCLHLYSEYTLWDHEVRAEKRKSAEERSFWTHIKIFEKSDGEGKSTRTHSAAFLPEDSEKDLAN